MCNIKSLTCHLSKLIHEWRQIWNDFTTSNFCQNYLKHTLVRPYFLHVYFYTCFYACHTWVNWTGKFYQKCPKNTNPTCCQQQSDQNCPHLWLYYFFTISKEEINIMPWKRPTFNRSTNEGSGRTLLSWKLQEWPDYICQILEAK